MMDMFAKQNKKLKTYTEWIFLPNRVKKIIKAYFKNYRPIRIDSGRKNKTSSINRKRLGRNFNNFFGKD